MEGCNHVRVAPAARAQYETDYFERGPKQDWALGFLNQSELGHELPIVGQRFAKQLNHFCCDGLTSHKELHLR
jgi:hypothetical protein